MTTFAKMTACRPLESSLNGHRACLPSGLRLAQVLLLSAHRDASGLTLTAASHVIIMEPQPDVIIHTPVNLHRTLTRLEVLSSSSAFLHQVAVELQMIGRVHRIGQKRQTHVYRILVADSFEEHIVGERQERWHRSSP